MTTFNINGTNVNGVTQVASWISTGLNELSIQYAERFGKELTEPTIEWTNNRGEKQTKKDKNEALTTSQIRNVYGEVQKMKMKTEGEATVVNFKEFN
jgi:hypothetical protein